MSSDIGPSWLNFWNAGPLGPTGPADGMTGPTGPAGPSPEGIAGTFYRGLPPQQLTSGTTTVAFQVLAPWQLSGYLDVSGSGFECKIRGVYQLEANVVVQPNGSVWTNLLKGVQISVNRAGNNQVCLANNGNISSGLPYTMQCVGTIALEVGDHVTVQVFNQFTAGPPVIDVFSTTYDLNSFFTWSLVKTY